MTEPASTTDTEPSADGAPVCAYPGCGRPPRPGITEGRGSKPKYCDLTGDDGKYLHTAMTAFRVRDSLKRPGGQSPDDLDRPVTMATARAENLRTGLLSDAEGLIQKLTAAVDQLRTVADPGSIEAQMEAERADAEEQVATARGELVREAQRRQRADADAEEARAAAAEMDDQLRAAETARAAAETARAEAEAETARAREDADDRVRAAGEARDAAIAAAEDGKAAGIADAQARADREIADARAAADARVTAAEGERDRARDAAVRADQRAAAAEARADEARAAHAAELARLEAAAARELDQARIQAAERVTAAETRTAELREELAGTRRENAETAARTADAHAAEITRLQAAADREHQALTQRIGELSAALEDQRRRADRAETALTAARDDENK